MDTEAIDRHLQQRADEDEFSGVIRVEQSGKVLLERGYGLASRTWGVPCRPEHRFDTASITKVFTAVAVLQQVEAGAFALDSSVVGYLGLEDTRVAPEVTPYHLLTHTSGIGDDADEEDGVEYEDAVRRAAELLARRDRRLPAPVCVQRAEVRARRGHPLLQLLLRAARPDGGACVGHALPRVRDASRVRAGRAWSAPASSGWTGSSRTSPRAQTR